MTPELKTQIAAVEKELADITREIGVPNAGRGGSVVEGAVVVLAARPADVAVRRRR